MVWLWRLKLWSASSARAKRSLTASVEHHEFLKTQICPPGNDPPAFQAAINIACSCFRDWAAGKTFEGKPYVKYDSRSKRLVFLDLEEKVGMRQENVLELKRGPSSGQLKPNTV